MTLILGIETSCDETAASVVEDGRRVLSNVVSSQHDLHRKYQGVVPEIASRAHLERIMPVVQEALDRAAIKIEQIDAVAVGNRPGLIGSLLVGVSAAQAISWAMQRPLLGINHIEAHLYAGCLEDGTGGQRSGGGAAEGRRINGDWEATPSSSPSLRAEGGTPASRPSMKEGGGLSFPALGLVVSGGHTSLYEIEGETKMRLLGKTIDDAVGEAYDKAAVILDAGYPGGPKLDELAQRGTPGMVDLPRSTLGPDSLDFSFSGLKTALLYAVRGKPQRRGERAVFERSVSDLTDQHRADLAACFQLAAIDALMLKLQRAIDQQTKNGRRPCCLIIGGGVSANSLLRSRAKRLGEQTDLNVHLSALAYCLDNAAMIAGLAHAYFRQGRFDDYDLPAISTASAH